MKQLFSTAFAALLLIGSTGAFAAVNTYTDLDSGFRLKAQPSWMEIGGKNFYGIANKPDKKEASVNLVCAFTAKEVEEETGKKFSTEEFMRKFKDLQVLERNGISPDKVNYIIFMPDPYEIKEDNKLSLVPKELLDNSSISISTNKKGKTPYVYLHIVEKSDKDDDALKKLRRPVDVQLALTSQNDMLYTVVSTFPLPNLKAQKKIIEEATPFSREKTRNEFNGGNKEKLNSYIASRKAFLNGLSFFPPQREEESYGFTDALLGGKIRLPEDWAYMQVNDDTINEKIPLKLTLATPWKGVSDILNCRDGAESALDKKDIGKLNFQKINEVMLFASSKAKDKNAFAELFNSPLLTQLAVDRIIKEGLKHPSVKNFVDFKELKATSNFTENYGKIYLTGNGSVKNSCEFNLDANVMFTPQNFGLTCYIAKDDKKMDPELSKIFDRISLSRH